VRELTVLGKKRETEGGRGGKGNRRGSRKLEKDREERRLMVQFV